jgi:hypothetical protein
MLRHTLLLPFVIAAPLWAQGFTTAAEVRPILDMTRSNWIAIREWEGQDLLYFTHLESWRCGMDAIVYTVNDGLTFPYNPEPCHEGTAQPNALLAQDGHLPFLTFPLGSLQKVDIILTLDDGTQMQQDYLRAAVQIP